MRRAVLLIVGLMALALAAGYLKMVLTPASDEPPEDIGAYIPRTDGVSPVSAASGEARPGTSSQPQGVAGPLAPPPVNEPGAVKR
ncbi:hypothetical protein [Phenylobacterium sp.]|uniref:hypothetical protein n=1 Tax=Phenylobacterium sp. TaxID=1871053 RepID=UPI00286A4174|nr:hypothetical protein [Phenylobacterium sp.]